MNTNTVGFIGLGLIGGSLAKHIKNAYPKTRIIAHASRKETLTLAYEDQLISNDDFLPIEEFANCDLLFLCCPVKVNVDFLEQLKPYLKKTTIITDVGSVKGDIHKAINELGLDDQFIGGHPMAGSEKIGYANSSNHLLENAYYILTYEDGINIDTVKEFAKYIKSLKAIPIIVKPKEHDFATAAISHVPHVISASLVNMVRENETDDSLLKTIAAGGFKDITRISSSSPVMWEHICLTNKDEILKITDLYIDKLKEFTNAIQEEDGELINNLFSEAKEFRDNLPKKSAGMLPTIYELYMDLDDEAGAIATIATLLAVKDVSIKNIGIEHNREFQEGALRIEFYDEDAMNTAIDILEAKKYTLHLRK